MALKSKKGGRKAIEINFIGVDYLCILTVCMIPFVVAKIRTYIDIYCIYYIYAYITRIQGVFSCPGQLNR